MTARTELEQDAMSVARNLGSVLHSQRAAAFAWVNMQGDYQCPRCWVVNARRSFLLATTASLPTEAHFECPECAFHFVEQA